MERNQWRAKRRPRAGDSASVNRFGSRTAMGVMVFALCSVMFAATTTIPSVQAFVPSSYRSHASRLEAPARRTSRISLSETNNENDNPIADKEIPNGVWSPGLRKIIAGVASLGAIETGYLTYSKLAGSASLFCGNSQSAATSCDQVLNGPYSNVPFLDNVPLAFVGFVAYSSVVGLALLPLLTKDSNDKQNRILLTALTTAMGTFSIFLMTLLFGVLQASCPYCVFSAADSFMLANLALIGGCLPEGTIEGSEQRDTTGGKTVAVGFLGAFLGAVLVFGNGSIDAINSASPSSSTLLASTISGKNQQAGEMMLYAPPEITTDSSDRALSVAKSLNELDAKMYGAHWCSHCYDQKQTLGKQVFDKSQGTPLVEYVECSKDGINSASKVCKAKEIPGYPTWEIQGKLYPGEQSVEELEDLIKDIRSNKI